MSDISSNLRSFFTVKVRNYNSIYIVNGFLEKLFSLKVISPQLRSPWNGGFPVSAPPTRNMVTILICQLLKHFSKIRPTNCIFGSNVATSQLPSDARTISFAAIMNRPRTCASYSRGCDMPQPQHKSAAIPQLGH